MELADGDLEEFVDFFGYGLDFGVVAFAEKRLDRVHLAFEGLGADGEFVVHAETFHSAVQSGLVGCGFVAFVDERVYGVNHDWEAEFSGDFFDGVCDDGFHRWDACSCSPEKQNWGSAAVDDVLAGRDDVVAQDFRVQTHVVACFHVPIIVAEVEGEAFS